MRKKRIIEQNEVLFRKLNTANQEIEYLKRQIERKDNEIKELSGKVGEEVKENVSPALSELEKKVTEPDFKLEEDVEFASKIIGEIVLESARLSNILTADGEIKYKELVNLILGKAEVSKAEILSVTKESVSLENKKEKIYAVKDSTFEYFESVMAQR